ncbi:hypothetical protein NXW75_16950 [Bacteroides xylanisolvens]|nr:hypothetical protein [Bacteroides xylanisolvens]
MPDDSPVLPQQRTILLSTTKAKVMPQTPDHLMKETLYMKIIHLLDRHRTWLEIESIATVRNHTIVRNGRMTDILSRVLVVKAIHHHFPYTRGQVWQIAEYDMEQAIKSLRTTDGAFRQRIIKGELTTGGCGAYHIHCHTRCRPARPESTSIIHMLYIL